MTVFGSGDKKKAQQRQMIDQRNVTVPVWPTMMRGQMSNGRILGVDGSMWVYRTVPLSSVADAKSAKDIMEAAQPIMSMVSQMADLTPSRMNRRALSKSDYRQIHLLMLNIPKRWQPDRKLALADFFTSVFPDLDVDERVLLLGVRLRPRAGGSNSGLIAAAEALEENLTTGGTPISDFDRDYLVIDRAMQTAGLRNPTKDEISMAESWWSLGGQSDTPMIVHSDHIHVFMSTDAAQRAGNEPDVGDCTTWAPLNPTAHHEISLAAVDTFDFDMVDATDRRAQWATDFLDQGALAISVHALVEPARTTRAELRRNRKRFEADMNDSVAQGMMDRAEQDERLSKITQMENGYARENPADSLIDTTITVAFAGRNALGTFDADDYYGLARMNTMLNRQGQGLREMMLASHERGNPNRHDVPAQTVACSGLPSRSKIGDRDGVMIGQTERDRQIALFDLAAASATDSQPCCVVPGQTGSGKSSALDTIIETPSGRRLFGDLRIGDEVFGRDGQPCRVTGLSPIYTDHDCYDVHFSDGQVLTFDLEHQFVVSTWQQRNQIRHPKRVAAISAYEHAHELACRLDEVAGTLATREVDLKELKDILDEVAPDGPWTTPAMLLANLHMVDAPLRLEDRRVPATFSSDEIVKTAPVVVFDVAAFLEANIAVWSNLSGANKVQWGSAAQAKIDAARAVIDSIEPGTSETAPQIMRMLAEQDPDFPVGSRAAFIKVARRAGVVGVQERREVRVPLPRRERSIATQANVIDAAVALKSLAMRLRQQYAVRPVGEAAEQRMTVEEMLAAGVRRPGGAAQFAVRVPGAVQYPHADLPLDPYVVGAWLGDGSSRGSDFASEDVELMDEISRLTGIQYTTRQPSPRPVINHSRYLFSGLHSRVRATGMAHVDGNRAKLIKRIPEAYRTASQSQRLDLLQGLMDTDGTIDTNGGCELSLSDEDLARDVLSLIRSLGIKASMSVGPAGYRDEEGQYVACKDRHRIHFTTDQRVFRMARKAARLPEPGTLRETSNWLYITDIVARERVPVRCISVDSSDRTYLIGDHVPTSNTMLLLWIAAQGAEMGRPQIIIDPKTVDEVTTKSHDDIVLAAGGQVISLDSLTGSDGVFDPLRFAVDPETGTDFAVNMLLTVNPWGRMKEEYETPLTKAISYGVRHGASCTGEALKMALEHDGAPADMVNRVFALADSTPLFGALFGRRPESKGLRIADGITLIKVGRQSLQLPQPGKPPGNQQERIAVALVSQMVFGSAIALTGRKGVLHLDEGWVFLGAGASELQRLGRLARSQGVLPIIYTQKVSDILDASMRGFVSRGIILPMEDPDEALAACEFFDLDPDQNGRLRRITAKATVGDAPNPMSMRALVDPATRRVLRGAIGIYCDLNGRAVPVHIKLPQQFLDLSSTNPQDIERRERLRAEGKLTGVFGLRGAKASVKHPDWLDFPLGQYAADPRGAFASKALDVDRKTKVKDAVVRQVEKAVEEDDGWGMVLPAPVTAITGWDDDPDVPAPSQAAEPVPDVTTSQAEPEIEAESPAVPTTPEQDADDDW